MKDIKKPEFMLEAMRGRRGFIAVLEILIAIVVFVVSSIAMSIGTIPLMIGYFVSDPEFMKTAQAIADRWIRCNICRKCRTMHSICRIG